MKKVNIFLWFAFASIYINAQKTIVHGDFAIRDFFVDNDAIFYIEKRDVKNLNINNENKEFDTYFIGGYGLRVINNFTEIITISNEFEQNVSSLRFYDKKSKVVEEVYYYKKGKAIAAIQIPESKYMVISLNDNKIIIIDYSKKPVFKEVHKIQVKSLARAIFYHNKNLFYATDLGSIFKYNFKTKKSELIYACKEKITTLNFHNEDIIFTTLQGNIFTYNPTQRVAKKIKINNNFVLNTIINNDQLLCGTFNGSIIVVNLKSNEMEKQLNYHDRSVLSIVKGRGDYFYSSSLDRTLKKWKLN